LSGVPPKLPGLAAKTLAMPNTGPLCPNLGLRAGWASHRTHANLWTETCLQV